MILASSCAMKSFDLISVDLILSFPVIDSVLEEFLAWGCGGGEEKKEDGAGTGSDEDEAVVIREE